MADPRVGFYRAVRLLGYPHLWLASAPVVLHRERARRPGGCLLAANHASPFDVMLLTAAVPRMIWWLSIVELFQRPLPRWFLTAFGAMPLDRRRPDPATTRQVLAHLRAGRLVGMFPEGRLRPGADSVLRGGGIGPGVGRLARIANVPVLPCAVLGGEAFWRWRAWLPGARTPWAVAFGEPILPGTHADAAALAAAVATSLRTLAAEARAACPGLAGTEGE